MEISFKNRLIGGLLVAGAAVLWSLDGVFWRPQLYALDVLVVVFIEHLFGFILLSPFIIIFWRELRQISRKDCLALLWVSLFGGLIGTYAITQAFFTAFAGGASIAAVIIVQKLQPVFALLLSRLLLKERLAKNFYLWAGLAVLASYALIVDNNFSLSALKNLSFGQNAGLMALIAAFAFGSSTVLGKRLVNHLNYRVSAALRLGLTALLSLFLILMLGKADLAGQINGPQWQLFIIIAIMTAAVATTLYYRGLKQISASLATLLELFWPLSAIILDFVLNGNLLSPVQLTATTALLFFVYRAVKTGQPRFREFRAEVVEGKKVGGQLGYPTINLANQDLNIPHGIYLAKAKFDNKEYRALLHFGPQKTFASDISVEIYIPEKLDEIPPEIRVKPIKRIRSIKRFKNQEQLKIAIKKDIEFLEITNYKLQIPSNVAILKKIQ